MTGWSERKAFGIMQTHFWRQATRLVQNLPQQPTEIRCHELTRAVAKILDLSPNVRDGLAGCVQHTWIDLGDSCMTILDVYCPARLPMVQLIDVRLGAGLYGHKALPFYRVEALRTDIDSEQVERLILAMRG